MTRRRCILNRDLIDKTYATINFHRGAKVGEAVQIDHTASAALTYAGCICSGEFVDDMPLTVFGDCS